MRRLLLAGVGLLLAAVLGGAAYVESTWKRDFSSTPLPAVTAGTDPEVVARGAYLVQAVGACGDCHGDDLSGGPVLDAGPFGRFWPANLTTLGGLSDGLVARAVRNGVMHDGMLAPMMTVAVGPMADEDLVAVVSYLRTLAPVAHDVPADEWGPVAKLLSGRFDPRDDEIPAWVPPGGVSVERGAYLANGPAACVRCHTARDPLQGFVAVGRPFAGEPNPHVDKADPAYEIVAPNLTPDASTGAIARWTEDQFVARFRAGPVYAGSIMPWARFAKLTEDDVRSLWRYLASLPPVESDVGPVRRLAE